MNYPTTATINKTVCSSYTWHGTTYTTSGTYTFDSLNAKGCDSLTTLNLTVNYPTTASINKTVCSSYIWHGTTYTTSGTYTFDSLNAKGCDSLTTLNLTVNYPTISTTSINPACGVKSVDLNTGITSSITNLTVQFYLDAALTSQISNTVTGAGTFYAKVTNANGCSSSSNIVVNAFQVNPAVLTQSISPVCGQTTIDLSTAIISSTSGSTLTYYNDAALTIVETNPVKAAGTYYVKVSNTNGCSGSASIVVNKFKLNPTLSTKNIDPDCSTTFVDLNKGIISTTGGLTLGFYSDAAFTTAISNTVTTAGTYYVKATNADGCSSTSSIAISAFKGAITLTTQTLTPACGITTQDLSTAITSSTSGLTYTYYDDAALTIVETNPVKAAGTYYVKATNASGCSVSTSIVVKQFNKIPTIVTTGISTSCGVTTYDLSKGIISSTTGLTITYYSDNAAINQISNPVNVGGTYYAKVTTAAGCSALGSIVLDALKPNPVVTTTTITPDCGVTKIDLLSGVTSSINGLTLTYYQNAALTVVEANPVAAAGTYYVKATTVNGCTASQSILVKSFRAIPTITTKDISPACGATSVNLSTGITSPTTGLTINYYSDAALTSAVTNNITSSGLYYISVTTSLGCSSSTSVKVKDFTALPIVQPIVANSFVCTGSAILLTDNTPNGTWSSGNTAIGSIDNSGILSGLSAGNVLVTYTVTNVCGSTPVSTLVSVSGAKPNSEVITPTNPTCLYPQSGAINVSVNGYEGPYQFTLNSNGSYSVPWNITSLTQGTYRIDIYNNNNCPVDSAFINLAVGTDANCDTLFVPTAFMPLNPYRDNILKPFGGLVVKSINFRVFNRYGNLMYETHDVFGGWNGRKNGTLQETGAYVWYLQYTTSDNFVRELKGTSVLIK